MAKPQSEEVSEKNKKGEILEAYRDLLVKLKDMESAKPAVQKERKQKEEVKKEIETLSTNAIVSGLSSVKLTVAQAFEQIESEMLAQYKRLEVIQQAILIQNRELEQLHGITAEAESLTALVQAQEEYEREFNVRMQEEKASFEAEMQEKRLEWERKQQEVERAQKERDETLKKQRAREEEEYQYGIKIQRQRDQDEYQSRKAVLEQELEERQKELTSREEVLRRSEQELEELRSQVASFPSQLSEAESQAEERIRETLEAEHAYQCNLKEKEVEGEHRLSQQEISSLKAKIKEQEERIQQLTRKADEAGSQVQSIAMRAIDGAAGVTKRVGEWSAKSLAED